MGWFEEQIKNRRENNQKLFEASFSDLAGIHEKEGAITRESYILSQLSHFFGREKVEIPKNIEGLEGQLAFTMKSLGILGRKVLLKDAWNLDNREPILAYTKENDVPVLLLPKGNSTYYYVNYKTGRKSRISLAKAKMLKEEAYAFYQPLPSHKLTLKEYLSYFSKSIRPWDLVFVVFMSILTTGIGMFLPYLTKTLTGDVVNNKSYSLYLNITIFLIATGVVYILIKATQSFVNARVAIRIEKLMTETTMRRMLSLPPSFFRQYSTGELAARFSSVSHLSSLLFNGVFLTLLSSIMSLAFFTQIVQFTPALVVPVILILALSTGFTILISLLQVKVSRKQLLLSAKESGSSYQMISGIQKIRLAGAEKRAFAIWAKDYAMASEPLYHPPLLIRLSPVISTFLTLAGEILIYFIASKNGVEASSYLAFTASFASLSAACAVLAQISDSLSRVRPVLDMARPILEAEAEDEEGKEKVESLQGNIKLEHVSFAYQQESRTILQDIDIEVKEGEYIGVVGKTGCGKSTLIRLLLGFEKPTSGKIYFDGKDMDTLNLQSLRSKIGSVTQNGGVFHADILSNILITAPQLGEKDAWEAARIAGIADDINAMPMKMNTVISEGQGGISGGQRQRIMIARAIVNKPKVLLFDEATSALDNRCQKKITEALSSFHCTRIVIAHRLSTIKDCDRILYMEDGKILEQGTYEELVALGGKFAVLIERQKLN